MPAEPVDKLSSRSREVFAKRKVPIQESELNDKIKELHGYGIPPEEILRNTVRFFAKRHNVEMKGLSDDPYTDTHRNIKDLRNGELSITRAKVVQLWEPTCDKVIQSGLVGDETSTTKFMIAKSATVLALVEGVSYEFRNVVVRPWMGQMSIYVNRGSEVSRVQEDIKVKISARQVADRIKGVPRDVNREASK